MKQANKFIAFIIITVLTLLAYPSAVQAFPPLPSSIYGTVKANNANVADGSLVEAAINNQVVAQGYTQTYQGDSVYSLDVPGDDTSTAVIEGGKEGDTISFKIGGVSAVEKGVWHSATNVMLNLTISSSNMLNTPQATPTSVATQTPIIILYATDLPTIIPAEATKTAYVLNLTSTFIHPGAIIETPTFIVTSLTLTPQGASTGNALIPGGETIILILVIIFIFVLMLAILAIIIKIFRDRNKLE